MANIVPTNFSSPLTGNETLRAFGVSANGMPSGEDFYLTSSQIASTSSGTSGVTAIASLTGTGAATIPAASIYKKIVSRTGATAAFTDTTDTAANIIAAVPNFSIGQNFQFTYDNNTAYLATIAGGTGVTVSGVTSIPSGSYARYLVTYTAANTLTFVAFEGGIIGTPPSGAQYQAAANTTAFTATGPQVAGGSDCTLNLTGTLAAGAAITLPTVATLLAAMPNYTINSGYNLRIINSSSGNFSWTVTTNTGWTLNGTMTIAQNTFRDFVVTVTSGSACTLQQVGTGTTS